MTNPRHLLLRLATLAIALAAIFAPQTASAKSHANSETRVRDFSAALPNLTQAKPELTPDKHYEKLAQLRQLASGPPLVPKGGGAKYDGVAGSEISNGARMVEQPFSGSHLTKVGDLVPTHGIGQTSRRVKQALEASIAEKGMLEPIKYVTYKGRKYVVDGHHRLGAAKGLRMDKVPTVEVELPYGGYRTSADLGWDPY